MNLNDMNLNNDIKFYRDFIDKNNQNDNNHNDNNDDDNNGNNNHNRIYNDDDNLTIVTARENYQNSLKTNTKNDINRTKNDINRSDSFTNVNLVQPTSPYDHKSRTYVSTDYSISQELYNTDKDIENGTNSTYVSTNGVESIGTDARTVDNNLSFNEETKEISEKNSTDVSTVDIQSEDDFLDDHSHLLIHVKDIRSEKQLTALIEYIQDGYISIENTDIEKKKLKKIIKGWNDTFENANGRVATNQEKKTLVRDMYEDYQKVIFINVAVYIYMFIHICIHIYIL
jgi:SepF-like predicted cell division protein (DUF552 family)